MHADKSHRVTLGPVLLFLTAAASLGTILIYSCMH